MSNTDTGVSAEMPRYKCHKEIHALKIADVNSRADGVWLTPADTRYAAFRVNLEWYEKHSSQPTMVGGYYVVYADGYASFSPAKAFEDGYTLIK